MIHPKHHQFIILFSTTQFNCTAIRPSIAAFFSSSRLLYKFPQNIIYRADVLQVQLLRLYLLGVGPLVIIFRIARIWPSERIQAFVDVKQCVEKQWQQLSSFRTINDIKQYNTINELNAVFLQRTRSNKHI